LLNGSNLCNYVLTDPVAYPLLKVVEAACPRYNTQAGGVVT
jgi:hypothetical protein